jgi:HPt (histidine-containing phosphotransfer) domain-containing protein
MDMQMPVMDGLTAVRTLRERDYRGPIMALTANATQRDMQSCLEAGCDGFLTKPIERSTFAETLQRYLGTAAFSGEADEEMFQAPFAPLPQNNSALEELMRRFLNHALDEHKALQQTLETGNAEQIKAIARRLKSAGTDHMSPRITELAGQLEFAARAGNAAAARRAAGKIGKMIKRIEMSLPEAPAVQAPREDEMPMVSLLLEESPDMADLVEYFLTRLPGYEADLKDALSAGDLAALKKTAHDLKSVGGGYGYPLVTELAIELETRLAEGNLEQAGQLVARFSRLARRIEAGACIEPLPRAAVG